MEGVCDLIGVSDGRLCQVVVAELDGVGDLCRFSSCIHYLEAVVV